MKRQTISSQILGEVSPLTARFGKPRIERRDYRKYIRRRSAEWDRKDDFFFSPDVTRWYTSQHPTTRARRERKATTNGVNTG